MIVKNILAAFTLSIISLSMGGAFGIMSGRGAFLGILSTGIIIIITSLLGSTKIQCSGPTAPVTTLLVSFIATEPITKGLNITSTQFFNLVFILAGIGLLLVALFRLGRLISTIPNVVISGFMTGIGLLILQSQITNLLSYQHQDFFSQKLLLIGFVLAITFITPILLKKYVPRIAGLLSGTFLALILGTILAQMANFSLPQIQMGNTHNITTIFNNTSLPELTQIPFSVIFLALGFALQLCITMYLDSLLTSVVMDKMTGQKTQKNQEIAVHGFTNVIIGLIGGVPGAQATARSVLLLKEGATHRITGILVGLLVITWLFFFQKQLGLVPKAIFNGILIKVAFDIMDLKPLKIYATQWKKTNMFQNFFNSFSAKKTFITNREILFILGTAISTLLFGLIPAVFFWTALFWILQYTLWKTNPMRDLTPPREANLTRGED